MTAPRDAKLNQASKMPLVVISLAALLAGVGGGWYFAGGQNQEEQELAEDKGAAETQATRLSEVPADLKLTPDSVTGTVMLVSDRLEREPEKIVSVVVQAFKDGRLKPRPEEDSLRGAPLPASSVAPALQEGQGPMNIGPLEAVTLAGALLRGRGVGEPVYGVDTGADGGTNILLRRYLVRVGEDPWLAVDERPVVQESVRQLSAEELLADALSLDALSAMLRDDTRRASRASLQARALAPGDVAIRFTVGIIEVASDLVDKGLGTMESAARDAGDAESWITLGVTAMQVGQPFKAHRFLNEAATADPKMAKPHVALAQLALERLDLTPRAKQAEVIEEIRGHVKAAAEREPDAEGIAVIKAQLAVMADKPEEAEALLRAAVKKRSRDPVAWANLAQFLSIHGRQKEALEALEEASDYGVPGVEIQRQLADLLVAENHMDDAALALERVLEADPGDEEVRPKLAQVEAARGHTDRAMKLLNEHLGLWNDDHTTRLLAAQLSLEAGDPDGAQTHVNRVLQDAPDAKDATLLGYLILLASDRDASEARAAAIRVAGARSEVAQILLEQGFHEEAESLLREALEKEPSDGLAPVFLSALLVATDREEEAERIREKTLIRVAEPELRQVLQTEFDAAFAQARQVAKERAAEEGAEGDEEGDGAEEAESPPEAPAP